MDGDQSFAAIAGWPNLTSKTRHPRNPNCIKFAAPPHGRSEADPVFMDFNGDGKDDIAKFDQNGAYISTTMADQNGENKSMEEEKNEAPEAMEEDNVPSFTESGSPRLVIRQMVSF